MTSFSISASRFAACVVNLDEIAPRCFRLRLQAKFARAPRAGQFVHVLTRGSEHFDPLLRRAFSIASLDIESFDIVFRVEGKGTSALSCFLPGTPLDVLGPLGRPFHISTSPIWLVGGGVGVPPLAMLAQQESRARILEPQSIKTFVGARTSVELLCLDDFARHEVDIVTATEDGSAGFHGYVTQILETHLREHLLASGLMPMVCACGPTPMLSAVAKVCARFDVACQVSLEESMPCGIGVCNGCVVAMKDSVDEYGRYQRLCVHGPVMWAHEINW